MIHPGGRASTQALLAGAQITGASQVLNIGCGVATTVETQTGPFEMVPPHGFLADEGPARSLAIKTRVAARPASIRKMAWLMPRMAKAVPHLGCMLVAGQKPRQQWLDSSRATA